MRSCALNYDALDEISTGTSSPYIVTGMVDSDFNGAIGLKVLPDPRISFRNRTDGSTLTLATELKTESTFLRDSRKHAAQFVSALGVANTRVALLASPSDLSVIIVGREGNIDCRAGIDNLPECFALILALLERFRLQQIAL